MTADSLPVPRARSLPARTDGGEPKAAAVGAAMAGPAFAVGALANYALFASGVLAFEHAVTLGVTALVTPVFLSIPAARLAALVTRKYAARSPRQAAAAAAGSGVAAALVVLASFLLIPANLVELSLLAPVALGAAAAVGLVGAQAFAEVPGEETPNLYLGLLAAGLNGAHLAFWGALGAGTVTTLFPSFLPALLTTIPGQALGLFPVFSVAAISLGVLAPVSLTTGKLVGRARRRVPAGWLAAGLGLPLLVPIIVTLALSHAMGNFHLGRMSLTFGSLGAGFIVGLAPHSLAIYLGLQLGRREAAALAGREAQEQLAAEPT